MSLSECYKKAVLYPSIITIVTTLLYSIADNYDYKSEWLTADDVIYLSVITAFVYSLIICLLSAGIFLNKFEIIKHSAGLNFLTWFLLPFSFIIVVLVHEINSSIKLEGKLTSDFLYVVIL